MMPVLAFFAAYTESIWSDYCLSSRHDKIQKITNTNNHNELNIINSLITDETITIRLFIITKNPNLV